ncbi:hypothetical protein K1719_045835 [Acacia pycnantha]|nr:hypothetical protein K1719_045835 [Acacia pycnantha]
MIIHKCFLLIFFLIISFLCSATIEARPTYLYHNCSTVGKTFSANNTFRSHRTTLLSSLASANASFQNTTIPGGGSDTIYGLYMCRGDVSLQVCNQCVVNATQRLPSECPYSKEAVIWEGKIGGRAVNPSCNIRYELFSFFDTNQLNVTVPAPAPTPALAPTPAPNLAPVPYFPGANYLHHPPSRPPVWSNLKTWAASGLFLGILNGGILLEKMMR